MFYFDLSLLKNHSFSELVTRLALGVQTLLPGGYDPVKVEGPEAEVVRVYVQGRFGGLNFPCQQVIHNLLRILHTTLII